MAKKPMDDDLLTGGKLSSDDKKASKKTNKKSKAGISIAPKTAKIIKSVICVVVVVALLAAYVVTGTVRKGFVASLGLPAKTLTGMTVTNGEQKAKIKVATYNFYFATTYNSLVSQKAQYEQYGIDTSELGLNVDFDKKLSKQTYTDKDTKETMTWEEHLNQLVLDAIEETYTYYLAAVEANGGKEPELSDEQKSELEETLESYTSTANTNGFTLSGYLTRAMGKGVDEKVFRTEATRQYIADNYKSDLSSNIENRNYTAEDISKYKDENKDSFETVDILLFECDSEDDAKAFKNELKADGSNFADLASKYASTDSDKEAYKNVAFSTELGITRQNLKDKGSAVAQADAHEHEKDEDHSDDEELTYSGLDWIFSADRKAGDSYQKSTSVVYILSPASLEERNTVNVRHILVKPETSENATESTPEQWKAAYTKAQNILNDWKAGEATEDSFAALVADNTEDSGSKENGGLYENVVTGQMVNPFSVWCFDADRKVGDTAIVRTSYGYHIMYFSAVNDDKIWEYNAKQALASQDGSTESKQLEEDYTISVNWFASLYFEKDVDIDS